MKKLAIAVVPLLVAFVGCTDANKSADVDGVAAGEICGYQMDGSEPAKPVDPPSGTDVETKGTAEATINMSAGDVKITLDREKAPCAVNSFMSLAQQGYFDETDCHRLTDFGIFILQCGDPTGSGEGSPGYVFADEIDGSEEYLSGTVAMANRGPDTNGSQFFFVWDDSTSLEANYTVLGHIDEASLDVIRGIAAQGVDASDGRSPLGDAHIVGVTLG